MTPKWVGPFKIINKGLNYTYKLQDCNSGKTEMALVHASRLKHYQEPIQDSDSEDEEIDNGDLNVDFKNLTQTQQDPPHENTNDTETHNETIQVTPTNNDQNLQETQSQTQRPDIVKILKTCINCNRRLFRVEYSDGVKKWVEEKNVDQNLADEYWKTHTKAGKRQKKRKRHVFFRPKVE